MIDWAVRPVRIIEQQVKHLLDTNLLQSVVQPNNPVDFDCAQLK